MFPKKIFSVFCFLILIIAILFFLIRTSNAGTAEMKINIIAPGWSPPSPPSTKVVLSGRAYPSSTVNFLKDGVLVTTTTADSEGYFSGEITGISAGSYTFGVWAQDTDGRKSTTFSFTTSITSGMTVTFSNIFLPPTIEINKTILRRGETLNISGQSFLLGQVTVDFDATTIVDTTRAGGDGSWSYSYNTSALDEDFHTVKAKAQSLEEGITTSYSTLLTFYIGKAGVERICPGADLNHDGKVDLVDFSMLLYYWGQANTCADQNQNGVVDLPDFSIMMYYWTG